MPVHTVKLAGREYAVLPMTELQALCRRARSNGHGRRRSEDDYWTESAFKAEARAKAKGEKAVPLADVEPELDAAQARRGRRRSEQTGRASTDAQAPLPARSVASFMASGWVNAHEHGGITASAGAVESVQVTA